MTVFHNVLIWGGRFNLLIGTALLGMNFSSLPVLSRWWGGFALLLWVPVEVVARRMIHPDLKYMRDGASSSRTLILGGWFTIGSGGRDIWNNACEIKKTEDRNEHFQRLENSPSADQPSAEKISHDRRKKSIQNVPTKLILQGREEPEAKRRSEQNRR